MLDINQNIWTETDFFISHGEESNHLKDSIQSHWILTHKQTHCQHIKESPNLLLWNKNNKPSHYLGQRLGETVFLAPVTQEEINLKIKSLKDTATGYDEINAMSLN